MARVHMVEKNRSTLQCGRCRETIKPGAGYRYAQPGFRSRSKLIRCMKASCAFRQSELTSSDKLSRAYAAQENAEDAIHEWDGEEAEDIAQALRDAAQEITEVADEYRQSAENIRDRFSESQTADDCDEKADALEGWADEIESAADNLPDKPGDEDDEDKKKPDEQKPDEKTETLDDWRTEVRDAAMEPLNNCPL